MQPGFDAADMLRRGDEIIIRSRRIRAATTMARAVRRTGAVRHHPQSRGRDAHGFWLRHATFRALAESVADAFVLVDEAGCMTWVNEQTERLFGYTRHELMGRPVELLLPERFREQQVQNQAHPPRPRGRRLALRGLRKDGEEFPMELSVSPLEIGTGRLVVAAFRDTSDHRMSQGERELVAQYQSALAALAHRALDEPDLQPVLDEAVRVAAETLSVEYTNVLELEPDGVALRLRAGVGWSEGCVGHVSVPAGIESQAGFTLLLGVAELLVVDDVARETRFATAPLLGQHGVVSGISVVISSPEARLFGVLGAHTSRHRHFTTEEANFLRATADIISAQIARTDAEQHGRRARAAAEHANRGRDTFFAVLGHELRNPLAAIANLVTLLNRIGVQDPQAKWARAGISRQVRHLARLLDDLIDVARAARGTIELRRQLLDFGELVRTIAAEHARRFEEKRQSLIVDIPERRGRVAGDPDRLQQVVENLLANALKFTPAAGRITVTLRYEDGGVVLCVGDSGIGIAAGELKTIFELFRRGRSPDPERSGLGVGLALVERIVELHGGTVEARSGGPGTGSEFFVRLPLAEEAQAPAATGS